MINDHLKDPAPNEKGPQQQLRASVLVVKGIG
jgi:hypothetical protein